MKRTAKKIILAATIAAVSIQSAAPASACGGRGGRPAAPPVYGGYARAAANYRTTLPTTPPIYSVASSYSQPVYNQTPYNQTLHGQTTSTTLGQQPTNVTQSVAAVQPRPRAQVAAQTAAVQSLTAAVGTAANTAGQSTVTQQTASQTNAVNPAATNDAETSALAALASLANAGGSSATPATPAPVTQVASSAPATNAASAPVGVFTATLPSNVTIELRLNNGNTFSWIARDNGKTSQFNGQYRVADGRLTLVRSNDLQQMTGSMTSIENGFTFKLDGANAGGLDFKRV